MAVYEGPNVIHDGLVLCLDASNTNSYSGTGTTWLDLSSNAYQCTLSGSPTLYGKFLSFTWGKYGNITNDSTSLFTLGNTFTLHALFSDHNAGTDWGFICGFGDGDSNINLFHKTASRVLYNDGPVIADNYVTINVNSWIRNVTYVTVCGWYYHASNTDGAPWGIMTNVPAVSTSDGFWWHTSYSNNTLFLLRAEDNVHGESDGTGTPFLTTGNWYHLTSVVGNNIFDVYVNGTLYWSWGIYAGFSWSSINTDIAYLTIGISYISGIIGNISNLQLYNRNLSASEILQNHNALKGRFGL